MPDNLTRSELDAIGLGDPTEFLRRRAYTDFFVIAMIYFIVLIVAIVLDLGDIFHDWVRENEYWELDEFIVAALFTVIAAAWFTTRQWFRYAEEVSRRLKLEEDIVQMRIVTDQLGENKALFLKNLAHDFRTPLNGVIGFTQLLEEEPFGAIGNEHYKTYIANIRESADMLGDRIATCLDPDKIEFGAEPMQMMPFPLKKAVATALPIVRAMAERAAVTVKDDIPEDLPEIHGDVRAIKKVIINLATNAIKHCQNKGEVRLSAALTDDGRLTLAVEDKGVGMDATVIATLMRHTAGTTNPGMTNDGQGAGLFVAKNLLDMHDAALAVENRLGNGTVATVTFPRERVIRAA